MKLSHLTIAISVALSLAACGGSGSDNNSVDNSAGTGPGAGAGNGSGSTTTPTPTPTPEPEKDINGLEKPVDPRRDLPTGEVQENVKPQVEAAKKAYVDRSTRDSVTGYNIIEGGLSPVNNTVGCGTFNNTRCANVAPGPGLPAVPTSRLNTTQDGSVVQPNPFVSVELANRPAYANQGDMAPENVSVGYTQNTGVLSAVAARAFREADYPAYANQALQSVRGTALKNAAGQAGVVFYTGSTKVNNPTVDGNNNGDILRDASIINYASQTPLKSNGGIQANPDFSYALVGGNYYRVIPENNVRWSDIDPSTTFQTVVTIDPSGAALTGNTGISMDSILYIPNAATAANGDSSVRANAYDVGANNDRSKQAYKAGTTLGDSLGTLSTDNNPAGLNVVRGSQLGRIDDYDLGRANVVFKDFTLAGKTYDLGAGYSFENVSLDLSAVPSSRESKEITVLPINLDYTVIDGKATGTRIDDQSVDLTAAAGALKVYELPYHRSMISINQAAVENPNGTLARASNMFGFAGYNNFQGEGAGADGHYGPYQVLGYNQGTLPENGRADYRGKSFGVNSEGVLNLRADFGKERASVYGAVTNRKRLDSTAQTLPDLNLKPIILSQPATREHYASMGMLSSSSAPNGTVSRGSNSQWGTWAMSFYGPDAQEVGGVIAEGAQLNNTSLTNVVEVFSGERGRIIGSGAGSASGSLN